MKEFSAEELAGFAGKDGTPAYVAHGGKVYDVSASKLWKSGTHMMKHQAGAALDDQIKAAPHGPEVLERVPQVGVLKRPEPEQARLSGGGASPGFLDRHPFLKRHPHPMVVHFPIAFILGALALEAAAVVTGFASFGTSSLHCLGLGFVSLPFAIGTGYFTWMVNYQAGPIRPVRIKIWLSWLLFMIAAAVLVWRINASAGYAAGYFPALLVLSVLVGVIGYYGAKMTIGRA